MRSYLPITIVCLVAAGVASGFAEASDPSWDGVFSSYRDLDRVLQEQGPHRSLKQFMPKAPPVHRRSRPDGPGQEWVQTLRWSDGWATVTAPTLEQVERAAVTAGASPARTRLRAAAVERLLQMDRDVEYWEAVIANRCVRAAAFCGIASASTAGTAGPARGCQPESGNISFNPFSSPNPGAVVARPAESVFRAPDGLNLSGSFHVRGR